MSMSDTLEKPRKQILEVQAALDSLSKLRSGKLKKACKLSPSSPRFPASNAELEEDVFDSKDVFGED